MTIHHGLTATERQCARSKELNRALWPSNDAENRGGFGAWFDMFDKYVYMFYIFFLLGLLGLACGAHAKNRRPP